MSERFFKNYFGERMRKDEKAGNRMREEMIL